MVTSAREIRPDLRPRAPCVPSLSRELGLTEVTLYTGSTETTTIVSSKNNTVATATLESRPHVHQNG
jgi:hypothetical protein